MGLLENVVYEPYFSFIVATSERQYVSNENTACVMCTFFSFPVEKTKHKMLFSIQFNSIQNTLFVPESQFKRHEEQHH